MKRPNFFILGAPKCGTTSLAAWLAAHPAVYVPPTKEPHFFNTDGYPLTRSQRHYERLFAPAGHGHVAVGEASTGYLSSRDAVPLILEYAPAARFVVCLRNPVDMAPSLHEQRVFEGKEHVADFRTAWELQEARREGRAVAPWCRTPGDLLYDETCRLGSQMRRLYERVDSSRVLPLLLDDMRRDPSTAYRSVLDFLGVPDDGRHDFPVHNAAKERRYPGVNHVVRLAAAAKRGLGIQRGLGLLNRIDSGNTRERSRAPLPPETRGELAAYFETEVLTLSKLLGRDLRHWLRIDADLPRPA